MGFALELKRYGKAIFLFLEERLSRETFEAFYNFSFPKYKAIVRELYGAKRLLPVQGRPGMVERVYKAMPYTLVGVGGLEASYELACELNEEKLPGAFIELGVAQGGCAALISELAFESEAPEREVWLFDSFEGLPEPTEDDYIYGKTGNHMRPLPKGSCLGTLEEVKRLLFREYSLPESRIHLVKGWFQDTLPKEKNNVGPIALLRIDGDWYESTKCCLEHLYEQVVDGGAIIIDDFDSCFGCKKAVQEFLESRSLNPELHFDGRGGCFFRKTYETYRAQANI